MDWFHIAVAVLLVAVFVIAPIVFAVLDKIDKHKRDAECFRRLWQDELMGRQSRENDLRKLKEARRKLRDAVTAALQQDSEPEPEAK